MKKCLIIFQIVTQTVFHSILIVYELNLLLGDVAYNQINMVLAGFSTTAYLSSVTSVMTGICYSCAFQSYYRSFSRVFEYFKDDKKLKKSLKKASVFSIAFIFYSILFATFRSVDNYLKFSYLNPLILVAFLVSQTLTRISVVFEHLMLFVVVVFVVYLFKCLTSSVTVVQESIERCDITLNERCDITREQVQEWVEVYRDLANCCDQVMLCFGQQVLEYNLIILRGLFIYVKNQLIVFITAFLCSSFSFHYHCQYFTIF